MAKNDQAEERDRERFWTRECQLVDVVEAGNKLKTVSPETFNWYVVYVRCCFLFKPFFLLSRVGLFRCLEHELTLPHTKPYIRLKDFDIT